MRTNENIILPEGSEHGTESNPPPLPRVALKSICSQQIMKILHARKEEIQEERLKTGTDGEPHTIKGGRSRTAATGRNSKYVSLEYKHRALR
jgi:hypothetical protein